MSDNVRNYFKTLFQEAHRATMMSNFVEADDICHRLLREPTLPLLYRAGCNLLLAFGDDNPVGFAKEAVLWYQEMYDEVREHSTDGPHYKLLLEQAQDALANAEREAAEQADEADDDGEEGEDDDGKGSQEDASEEKEKVSESEVEAAAPATDPETSTAMEVPSSSLGGTTVIPSSSIVQTQVDDTTIEGEKKTTSSDAED